LPTARRQFITATYSGDAKFQPSTGGVAEVTVRYSTTTILNLKPNPSNFRQAVTFTATVAPSGPYPATGYVRFSDGTAWHVAVLLKNGTATFTKSNLALGTHPITAQYLGDAFSAKSTSLVLNQVVQ